MFIDKVITNGKEWVTREQEMLYASLKELRELIEKFEKNLDNLNQTNIDNLSAATIDVRDQAVSLLNWKSMVRMLEYNKKTEHNS